MAYDDALAAFAALDEQKLIRKELETVRQRFNALAVKVAKLEQENARLSDNGRIDSYLQTLQALTQLAVDVGIPDAESTGHDTLVVQLRERFKRLKEWNESASQIWAADIGKLQAACATIMDLQLQSKANQEAADVLRLIEAGPMTITPLAGGPLLWSVSCDRKGLGAGGFTNLSRCVRDVARRNGITLPAKDEQPNHQALYDGMKDTQQWVAEQTSPSPDVASGAEGEGASEYHLARIFDHEGGGWIIGRANQLDNICGSVCRVERQEETLARDVLAYLNGTSPVHQQLAEARAEIESLRRCQEAWDAVRKWGISLAFPEAGTTHWIADTGEVDADHADPIEAVLELAKTLEAKKS